MEIENLKIIANSNKRNHYFLKICLLGLYSEWEGFIKSKVDQLIEECNKHNQAKFKLQKEYFFSNRNLNNEEFKKLWKKIFNKDFSENKDLIDGSFFNQRKYYAHGNFEETNLDWKQLEKYFEKIKKIANLFSDEIDDFIKENKHLQQPPLN